MYTVSSSVHAGQLSPISIITFQNPELRKQFLGHWKTPVKQYHGSLKEHLQQDNERGLKIGPQIAPYDRLK
eukprot:3970720-Amphidinium_carterae.1